MSARIVICVSGGVVDDVYASDPNTEIVLIDRDNLREEMTREEMDALEEKETAGLLSLPIG